MTPVSHGAVHRGLQDVIDGTVETQVGGEQPVLTVAGLEDHCPGPVTEEDTGGAIGEVHDVVELLGADEQHCLGWCLPRIMLVPTTSP